MPEFRLQGLVAERRLGKVHGRFMVFERAPVPPVDPLAMELMKKGYR